MKKAAAPMYMGISLGVFRRLKVPVFFDVYVQRAEGKFTKLFNHGDMIDVERAAKYAQKGVSNFFVHKDEYIKYTSYIQKLSMKYLSEGKDANSVQKVTLIKELVSVTMHDLMNARCVDNRSLASASTAVEGCVSELQQDPKGLMKLFKYMSTYPHIYQHSIGTSILSIMLAKADGVENETNLKNIGLGGFLHDLGHAFLSFDPQKDVQVLTPKMWNEMRMHPELGKRQLDGVRSIRSEVKSIVLQHHEQWNGRGYPNGLKGQEIYYPARIVALADGFSALIKDRPDREAFRPTAALEIMRSDLGKYDPKLLELFTKMLIDPLLK